MKRIRIGQLSRQWRTTTPCPSSATAAAPRISRLSRPAPAASHTQIRCQTTTTNPTITPDAIYDEAAEKKATLKEEETREQGAGPQGSSPLPRELPSPLPDKALRSAKLAALHARLSLSKKLPVKILARALVDPSADAQPRFHNANLALVGASLLQYYTSEYLVMRYPRLPMTITLASMKGYTGEKALYQISRSWGVEEAGAPGAEVDPGYLQYSGDKPTIMMHKWGYVRAEAKELSKMKWPRAMSPLSGDTSPEQPSAPGSEVSDERNTKSLYIDDVVQNAHANFVRAVIGAIYLYSGSDAAKTFIKAHILARQLDFENLFEFKLPQRELTRLCARENFDPPVARLLSETGRLSRTPVYVVGIYSGRDRLGEAAGANLKAAKLAATINALKSWYLYSPGPVAMPSDMFAEDAAPWKPAYVDIGEIV
ncbi:ribonuclease III [Astrocystis sublimbata]|nr:ribonuclease III [Astrocystis sublimbata]